MFYMISYIPPGTTPKYQLTLKILVHGATDVRVSFSHYVRF